MSIEKKGLKGLKALGDDVRKRLQETQDEIQRMAQEQVKPMLRSTFEELFGKYPDLVAYRWTQYTPHFNDGDACVFHFGAAYAKIEGKDDYADCEDGFTYVEEFPVEGCEWAIKHNEPQHMFISKEMSSDLNDVESALQGMEDALEMVFGDHCQVTIGRDLEVEIEEYDHD